MFCTTIIPTISRPTLARAVQSVLDQTFDADDFEVVVVNDSGGPLPNEKWQRSERVRVINTARRERSVARNTGASIANGKYLHFLDDDDTILPDALNAFWALAQGSNAVWLYGSYCTTDNHGNLVEEIHPGIQGNILAMLVAGEGIPFQASLLRTNIFFEVGGYDPTLTACEDRDVGRRIALSGDIAYTPQMVAQIRIGEDGSSTNWLNLAQSDQWGREKVLNVDATFGRLRSSARSQYWRGRVTRAYLSSMLWNLKRRSLMIAISRLMSGLAITGLMPLSRDYWRGLRLIR